MSQPAFVNGAVHSFFRLRIAKSGNHPPLLRMRIFILSILFCFGARAADAPDENPYAPYVFESPAAMNQWATSTWGGAKTQEFNYRKQRLVVYFRSHTSGLPTSQPVVFVEKNGRWIQVLSAMMCRFEMEATMEGDSLILWRLEWPDGKRKKTEFLRFSLTNLDAI